MSSTIRTGTTIMGALAGGTRGNHGLQRVPDAGGRVPRSSRQRTSARLVALDER